jgi:hypothetical protein
LFSRSEYGRGDLVQGTTMKLALLAIVVATAAPAFADPCKPGGTPLFTIDHQGVATQPTSTTTVLTSGAWTITGKDAGGKPTAAKAGCLGQREAGALEKLIASVPWTVTTKRINCKVAATTWMVDSIKGKEVFTERVCGRDVLDDKSAAALTEIHAMLDKL